MVWYYHTRYVVLLRSSRTCATATDLAEFGDEIVAATHVRGAVANALRAPVRSFSLRELSQS